MRSQQETPVARRSHQQIIAGLNLDISPIDEPSKSFAQRTTIVCSAKTIANFYRRATEAGKFFESSINPVEKRDLKEIERRWLS
jgi:hypothetical protein